MAGLISAVIAGFVSVLCREQPDIAIRLLSALGRELSVRTSHANMTILQLET